MDKASTVPEIPNSSTLKVMDELAASLENIQISEFSVGNSYMVAVTHINNPHSFYVRVIEDGKCLPMLEEKGNRISNVYCGMKVLYQSKILNKLARGLVSYIEHPQNEHMQPMCNLTAIDYGIKENSIPLSQIYKRKNEMDVQPLAVHCYLEQCFPHGKVFDAEAIDAMKFFVGNERARVDILGKQHEKFVVRLHNSCPDDIGKMLAKTDYTNLGYSQTERVGQSTSSTSIGHFTHKKLAVGDILNVRVQGGINLNSFYVAECDDYKRYLLEQDQIKEFCRNHKSLEKNQIRVGLPVWVKSRVDFKPERAVISKIIDADEKVEIILVDWGKKTEVAYSALKLLPNSFLHAPIMALFVQAEKNWSLENSFLVPGCEFTIRITKLGFQFDVPSTVLMSPLCN